MAEKHKNVYYGPLVHRYYIYYFSWDDHSQHLIGLQGDSISPRFVEELPRHGGWSLAENISSLDHLVSQDLAG